MKRVLILGAVIIGIILLYACSGFGSGSGSSSKLSDSYNEEDVTAKAKEAILVIQTKDYDSINGLLREDLRDQLTADSIKQAWDKRLTDAGNFIEYKSITTVGQKSKTTGEDYAAVLLTCTYEKDTLVYTITMDAKLEIVGMYMK